MVTGLHKPHSDAQQSAQPTLEAAAYLEAAIDHYEQGRKAYWDVSTAVARLVRLAQTSDALHDVIDELAALRRAHSKMGNAFRQAHQSIVEGASLLDPIVEAMPRRAARELQ